MKLMEKKKIFVLDTIRECVLHGPFDPFETVVREMRILLSSSDGTIFVTSNIDKAGIK